MFMNGEQFYKDHIIRWKNTGTSIRAYCREYQISYDAFRYWLGKKEASRENLNKGKKGSQLTSKNPVSKNNSFLPVEIRENQDIQVNGSILQIRMEADGSIHISIGRKL